MITTMPTGLLARVQKLSESNQQLTGKVTELEKRLQAIEQALTAPLPDEPKQLDGAPNDWPDELKIQIVREWREARKAGKQDEVYAKYPGTSLGHIRYWGRLVDAEG